MSQCDQCHTEIEPGEEREHRGQVLCEDCIMDALSPAKACDPWAVYSAKSLEQHTGSPPVLTPVQSEILRILEEAGEIERGDLLARLEGRLTMLQLEREFATLRHMEKARATKTDGKILLRLW